MADRDGQDGRDAGAAGAAMHVRRNDGAGRYELEVDGDVVGFADFRRTGEHEVELPHTVIDSARRGEGLGAVLVRGVLDELRAEGTRVIPSCWYVAQFIEEHADYADLLAA